MIGTEFALVETRVRAWSGDTTGAVDYVRTELQRDRPFSACSDAGPAMLAQAAAASDDAGQIAEFRRALETWIVDEFWHGGEPSEIGDLRRQLAAELHRDDPVVWGEIADDWDARHRRPNAAYARYRQAAALITAGESERAGEAARDAYAIATSLGFVPMVERIAAFARATGLDLGEAIAPRSPAEAVGLTAREREVLTLLSEGRTNRQIGEALYISTKTASVHVSNILAKLHVSNRGEAAAAARRLGLDGSGPADQSASRKSVDQPSAEMPSASS
jgi:DNA-binding CsgD family transcriptional regulator